jgi:hypothetical protein
VTKMFSWWLWNYQWHSVLRAAVTSDKWWKHHTCDQQENIQEKFISLRKKHPKKWSWNCWLLHENTPVHRLLVVKKYFAKVQYDGFWTSLVLSLPGFFLFPLLKSDLWVLTVTAKVREHWQRYQKMVLESLWLLERVYHCPRELLGRNTCFLVINWFWELLEATCRWNSLR